MDPNRVIIFDTTLRDGEQSPGISLNPNEKLEIAHQLARLGVDVIEAGFPIASPGDFQAVQAIAREVHGPVIAGLARAHAADIERAAEAVSDAERPRDAHVHLHVATSTSSTSCSPRAPTCWARPRPPSRTRARWSRTSSSARWTPPAPTSSSPPRSSQPRIDEGATTINIPDTVGYAMPNEYAAFLAGLYELVPGAARRRAVRPLPRRPRPGRGELVRRPAGGRAPGGVRDQRHRRARGQRVARGDRDAAAARARTHVGFDTGDQHARDRAHRAGSSRA